MTAALHSVNSAESAAFLSGLNASIARQPEAFVLRSWLDLASGKMTFAEFYKRSREQHKLSFLTVDVTPLCDLICEGMCYYHPDIAKNKNSVPEDLLNRAVSDAAQFLGLSTLIIAGKEPLLNPRRFFSLLRNLPAVHNRSYTVGTVTNGRQLYRHWDEMQDIVNQGKLDFLDISLDSGIAAEHDAIRGRAGTFERAMTALTESSKRLDGVRLGVTSVFRESNEDGLLSLLHVASPWTKNFYITPIQPPPYSKISPLSIGAVTGFLRRLHRELENLDAERSIEITVLLPGLYVMEVSEAGFFSWGNLMEDERGSVFVAVPINGHTLIYVLAVLPEQAWRVARITHDGAYLAHLHFMQSPIPGNHAVGYLQQDSILELYEKSLQPDTPFHRIALSRAGHQCAERACWQTCFGGWSVAENAILVGEALDLQPKLCLKGYGI